MDYVDFNIKIGPKTGENQYLVSARSAMGDARGTFTPPFSTEKLQLLVLRIGMQRTGTRKIRSENWGAAQDFGQTLFKAVFNEDIRAAFLASQSQATRDGKGLRIRIALDEPALANYPWEFLYDAGQARFLALFDETPIVRFVELNRAIPPLNIPPPLRILAVASAPNDFETLDIQREKNNLSQALQDLVGQGRLEIDWLPAANLASLQMQLLKKDYHIFHFVGHGGFDDAKQDGVLVFENENGSSHMVSGERLAVILGGGRTIRLAVLNACDGARTSEQDPFAGTALTLVRTGNLPAVVAMQFPVSDVAAIDFANGFYSALAAGRPMDTAVTIGRKAIFAKDNDVEWSTPVLYLRAADGIIFNLPPPPAVSAAPAPVPASGPERAQVREGAYRREPDARASQKNTVLSPSPAPQTPGKSFPWKWVGLGVLVLAVAGALAIFALVPGLNPLSPVPPPTTASAAFVPPGQTVAPTNAPPPTAPVTVPTSPPPTAAPAPVPPTAFLAPPTEIADPTFGRPDVISGHINSGNGTLLRNIPVSLYRYNGDVRFDPVNLLASTSTDRDGFFYFLDVTPGKYWVVYNSVTNRPFQCGTLVPTYEGVAVEPYTISCRLVEKSNSAESVGYEPLLKTDIHVLFPENNAIIPDDPTARWAPYSGATNYSFYLYADPWQDERELPGTQETFIALPSSLDRSAVYTLRIIAKDSQGNWLAETYVTFRLS